MANWANQRAYYELCYSDTVPLYGAELLSQGRFPYKSSWRETDSTGQPKTQYDGTPAVRYMEYPVLTGVYQYVSMALAKTYTALTKAVSLPVVAEVVMFFDIAALGLALAWLVTVWAAARSVRAPGLGRGAGGGLADPDLPGVHQFRRAGNGFRDGRDARLGAPEARAGRGVDRSRGGRQAVSRCCCCCRCWCSACEPAGCGEVGQDGGGRGAGVVRREPADLLLFPRGWSEFFRLNARRGDDMDSLYNVVKSFTGWKGFDQNLGFWQPPVVLNSVVAVLFVLCCAAIGYIALTAPQRPRVAQLAFLVVAAFLLTNKVWSPQFSLWLVPLAVLALPHRRILLAWMTIDALVWVPRMLYLYGEQNKGLPEQWFTTTVLLRDIAVVVLCLLVDPPDLPAGAGSGPVERTRRRSGRRAVRPGARQPAGLATGAPAAEAIAARRSADRPRLRRGRRVALTVRVDTANVHPGGKSVGGLHLTARSRLRAARRRRP